MISTRRSGLSRGEKEHGDEHPNAIQRHHTQPAPKPRMVFIDATRATAIILAIVAHGLITFRVFESIPETADYIIRFPMSAATPTFMLLFGIMLEVVSFARLEKGPAGLMNRRLIQRSGMCYLGCMVIVAAAVVSGRMTLGQAGFAALFMDNANFGNILKFYTIAMVLAIPLLALRRRAGIMGTIVIGVSPWLLTPWMSGISWPDPDNPLGYLTALLVGQPSSPNARYSIMHALTLIVGGMGLGWVLRKAKRDANWGLFRRVLIGLLVAAGVVYAGLAAVGRLDDVLIGYATWYRYTQHPGYYLVGGTSVILILLTWSVLIPPGGHMTPKLKRRTLLGRRALLSYTLSNAILCLWPYEWVPHPAVGVALAFLAVPLTYLIVAGYEAWVESRQDRPAQASSPAPVTATAAGDHTPARSQAEQPVLR